MTFNDLSKLVQLPLLLQRIGEDMEEWLKAHPFRDRPERIRVSQDVYVKLGQLETSGCAHVTRVGGRMHVLGVRTTYTMDKSWNDRVEFS